ncbi:ribbon-helix-helix domain-containing protein [Elioraea sp. Yellowstone]|jgi:predicted DNA-binding ribbon-helix-helix protein|uniref:ribbon-helix-helix domain-containing protein n=1 Tax=Elioraea sp. Yellowstone TaxID=2592070 RepID=UPI001153BC9A|nr:ribbon-helix-helix domain-containing protein [Elioraea sp. Yellowstone]TQF77752.1 ribbon-helix-helix domain-containing protein [Elioraea sp. Yellowstone]
MPRSTLVNRNIVAERGRTSMRLEPELWDALAEICRRERTSPSELCRRLERSGLSGGRTSAMRVFIVQYFRAAATEEGHAAAGHGAGAAQPVRPSNGHAGLEARPALAAYGAD